MIMMDHRAGFQLTIRFSVNTAFWFVECCPVSKICLPIQFYFTKLYLEASASLFFEISTCCYVQYSLIKMYKELWLREKIKMKQLELTWVIMVQDQTWLLMMEFTASISQDMMDLMEGTHSDVKSKGMMIQCLSPKKVEQNQLAIQNKVS